MADERTNEEIADALKEWAHSRRDYADEHAVDEGLTELLDEAARRLREQGGERITGWASRFVKFQGSKGVEEIAADFTTYERVTYEDQRRVTLILHPQERSEHG